MFVKSRWYDGPPSVGRGFGDARQKHCGCGPSAMMRWREALQEYRDRGAGAYGDRISFCFPIEDLGVLGFPLVVSDVVHTNSCFHARPSPTP